MMKLTLFTPQSVRNGESLAKTENYKLSCSSKHISRHATWGWPKPAQGMAGRDSEGRIRLISSPRATLFLLWPPPNYLPCWSCHIRLSLPFCFLTEGLTECCSGACGNQKGTFWQERGHDLIWNEKQQPIWAALGSCLYLRRATPFLPCSLAAHKPELIIPQAHLAHWGSYQTESAKSKGKTPTNQNHLWRKARDYPEYTSKHTDPQASSQEANELLQQLQMEFALN